MKTSLFILAVLFSIHLNAQWQPSTGTSGTSVISLSSNGSRCFAGTWGSGVFQSSNDGSSWTSSNTGLTNLYAYPILLIDSNVYAGTIGGGIFISSDSGGFWNSCSNGLTDSLIYAFAKKGTNIFAGLNGGGGGLYETNAGSCNWNYLYGIDILSLVFNDTDLYVGTCGAIFLSHDLGASYSLLNTGLIDYCICSIVFLGNNIFASTDTGGVLLSTDNGNNWHPINNGLPTNFSIRSLALEGTNIFAVTAGAGVFLSSDSGNTWNAINTGLTNLDVRAITISNGNIIIGTWGGGAWYRPLSDILTSINELNSTSDFTIFPNPTEGSFTFSTETDIRNAYLEVYNLVGKKIYSAVLESNQQIFNTKFPSGIYIVELKSAEKVEVKRLVVQH